MNVLLMIISLLSSPPSFCSCAEGGKISEEEYQSYDTILKGEIVKIQKEEVYKTLFIEVKTLYRGEHKTKTIEIITSNKPGFCGLNAGTGDEWLIFAYAKEETFLTDICTRSKNLEPDNHMYRHQKEEIKNDLAFLEAKLAIEE